MRRLTTEEFVEKAKRVHDDTYDYSECIYIRAIDEVKIICKKHGAFMQLPYNHLKGWGCAQCNKVESRRMTINEFIRRSRLIHGDKFDYTKVEYHNSKTPVEIVCPVHGSFMQKPEKHLVGQGCPKCRKNVQDNTETFVAKARKIHGELYDYSKVNYVNEHTKVCIVDPDFGEFWQQPNAHLNGRGSPYRKPMRCYETKKANNSFHTSKAEVIMHEMLVAKFGEDDVCCQYKSDVYPFSCDFYIKSLDLYVELNAYVSHGFHWFDKTNPDDLDRLHKLESRRKPRNLYDHMITIWTESDLIKRDTAIRNNLNYVVFWDNDLTDFKEWYESFDCNPVLKRI